MPVGECWRHKRDKRHFCAKTVLPALPLAPLRWNLQTCSQGHRPRLATEMNNSFDQKGTWVSIERLRITHVPNSFSSRKGKRLITTWKGPTGPAHDAIISNRTWVLVTGKQDRYVPEIALWTNTWRLGTSSAGSSWWLMPGMILYLSQPFSSPTFPHQMRQIDSTYSNRDYENPLQHLVTTCPLNHPIYGATAETCSHVWCDRCWALHDGSPRQAQRKAPKDQTAEKHPSLHGGTCSKYGIWTSFPFLLLDSYRFSKLRKWAKAFGWWCATACYNIVSRHHLHQTLHLATACCSMLGEVWRADIVLMSSASRASNVKAATANTKSVTLWWT